MKKLAALLPMSLLCVACGSSDNDPVQGSVAKEMAFDLTFAEGWTAEFADYPDGSDDIYQLSSTIGQLPAPLQQLRGLNLQGTNRSDDLFMFAHRKLTGLKANQNYLADIELTFATNVASNCFGVGGSPGESVYVKAGVEQIEPQVSMGGGGLFTVNFDKGQQSTSGKRVKTLGDFANSQDCGMNPETPYELKTVSTTTPIELTSTADGEAWVIVGTDSGFESTTSIWYVSAELVLKPE